MKQHTRILLLLIISVSPILSCLLLYGAEDTATEANVVQVSTKLYAITGFGGSGNIGFLVTDEGVVVVDSGESVAAGKKILSMVREKTDKPVRYVILTHYHTDHILGLQNFTDTATVIGHENVRKNMIEITAEEQKGYPEFLEGLRKDIEKLKKEKSPDFKKVEARLEANLKEWEPLKDAHLIFPGITFDKKLTLYLGGETIEIIYPGNTHTNGSSLIYFKTQKAVHTGDMVFSGSHTYIDDHAGANTANWISFLKSVKSWDFDKIIPGHGDVGGKELIDHEIAYLEYVRKEVGAAIAKGLTLEETQKTVTLEAYKDLKWDDLKPVVIRAVYKELTAK